MEWLRAFHAAPWRSSRFHHCCSAAARIKLYDALQIQRIYYARRASEHALPEWRLWHSPAHFLKAYTARLWHFYEYFVDAAVKRSEAGDRMGAVRAYTAPYLYFPARDLSLVASRLGKQHHTLTFHWRPDTTGCKRGPPIVRVVSRGRQPMAILRWTRSNISVSSPDAIVSART
jgi:hypothetical protein